MATLTLARLLPWLAPFVLTGCAGLLPRGSSQEDAHFASFEAAREAIEQVMPYRTREPELKALGFDPQARANVHVLAYPDVVGRLSPNPGVPLDALDPGIRDCILARQRCRAYEFRASRQARQRQGPFLLDFLNFRRTTVVHGWRFEGLVVLLDDLVVFRSHGGEPRIERTERQTNPLGPFQPAGESSGGLLRR